MLINRCLFIAVTSLDPTSRVRQTPPKNSASVTFTNAASRTLKACLFIHLPKVYFFNFINPLQELMHATAPSANTNCR